MSYDYTTPTDQVNSPSSHKHIFRVQRNKDFVTINKKCLEDERLSLKAKGLHCLMLAQRDDWVFYIDDLVKRSKDGRDSVKAGLKELQQFGYINKYSVRDTKGRISHWVTDVFEYPQPQLITTNTTCGKKRSTRSGISTSGFPTSGETHPNKNNSNNKININKNNNVEAAAAVVDIELEREVTKRLTKLKSTGLLANEDVERLVPEVVYHVTHRPEHITAKHSTNAAIFLIKKGTWSTPKGMRSKEIDDRETKFENDRIRERNDAVQNELGKMMAGKMRF